MQTKYFTVAEANALLPSIKPLVGKLLEKQAKVTQMRSQIPQLIGDLRSNVGSRQTSEMVVQL